MMVSWNDIAKKLDGNIVTVRLSTIFVNRDNIESHANMNKVIVDIYFTGNNYCAYAPILLGCVSTAATLAEMKKNIKEAIEFHVETSLENNDPIPEVFKGEYELEFKL